MSTLKNIHQKHMGYVSDKWEIYLNTYDSTFQPYKKMPINLLEIGVQNGGSLEVWDKYFPNAKNIIGCDINEKCAVLDYDADRISVVIGDAGDQNVTRRIATICEDFDIVIDDGSHSSSDIVRAFVQYFPMLSDGGVYVAEDLHCSYWEQYEGGLFHPHSSISFFKALADVVNFEHWGVTVDSTEPLLSIFDKYGCRLSPEMLSHIHSIEFINSVCVIKKRSPNQNVLGKHIIAGREELVVQGHLPLNGDYLASPDQSSNQWNVSLETQTAELQSEVTGLQSEVTGLQSEVAGLQSEVTGLQSEVTGLKQIVSQRDVQIAELQKGTSQRDAYISALINSVSWKITKPYRFLGRSVKRIGAYARFIRTLIATYGIGALVGKVWSALSADGVVGITRRLRDLKALYKTTGKVVISDYQSLTVAEASFAPPSLDVQNGVKISVIISIYKTPLDMLEQAIKSVINQSYSNWELVLVDDCSKSKKIDKLIKKIQLNDPRIKFVSRTENGNISAANNTGLEQVTGTFFSVLDHDDALHPDALHWVAHTINKRPDVDYIYTDEDKLTADGKQCFGPFFKPDWSPEYMLAMMYTCHMSVFRTELVKTLGGYDSTFDGAQDYDLALRVVNQSRNVEHIPAVLYHWRVWENSTADSIDAKPESLRNARRALEAHLSEKGDSFQITDSKYKGHFNVDFFPKGKPLVSIVIPTANGTIEIGSRQEQHINAVCESIFEKTEYENYEIVVVHNGDLDQKQLTWFESIKNVQLSLYQSEQFSLAEKINQGANEANGEYLVIMNDDIRVISPNWLTLMLGMVQREGVGVVGPKLIFPDNTIQHAGVVLLGGLPGHPYYQWPSDALGYVMGAAVNRNYSAVTGACSITPKKLFDELGGYSERYPLNYNDVDYCLRASQLGYRSVYLANVELYHYEGVSKDGGRSVGDLEISAFLNDWGEKLKHDPYYNISLNQSNPYE